MRVSRKTYMLCTAFAWAACMGGEALAQAEDLSTVEEIVVTARKRSESLQEAPISITVLSDRQLKNAGVTNFQDYATRIPNLSFSYGSSAGPLAQTITLRGVYGGGTTGLYLDETPLPGSIDPEVVDLERIEVLRGPQGSLYGARSMGGTVRLITKAPDLGADRVSGELVARGSFTKEANANGDISGTLNVPIAADRLAARVFAFSEYESGIFERVASADAPVAFAPHDGIGSSRRQGASVALKADLLDGRLSITPRIVTQSTTRQGRPYADYRAGNFTQSRQFDINEPGSDDWTLYSLTARYKAPIGEFTSATSHFDRDYSDSEDISEFIQLVLGSDPVPSVIRVHGSTVSDAQELRFASAFDGPFQITAGLFYQKTENGIVIPPTPIPGFSDNAYSQTIDSEVTEKAVFGEATLALTERLELSVGARLFENTVDYVNSQDGDLTSPATFAGVQKENGLNPKIGLKYKLDDDAILFATAAKGFRVGGVNGFSQTLCAGDLAALGLTPEEASAYDSDSLWSYEAGVKTSWFQRRLQVNATAFVIDWSDVQQSVPLACGFSVQVNAGKARSQGMELEVQANPVEGLSLSLGVGYTDAQITDGGALGIVHAGDRVQQVPRWNVNAALDYDFHLRSTPAFVHLDYAFVDESVSALNDIVTPRLRPSYSLVNARVGVEVGPVRYSLFAKNLFDEAPNYGDAPPLGAELPGRQRITVGRPRTVGVELRARF